MKKQSAGLLGNHNRSWVWGRNAVREILRAGRWIPLRLVIADDLEPGLIREAKSCSQTHDIPLEIVPFEEVAKFCRHDDHQGFAAQMPEFPYANLDELLRGTPQPTAMVLLDGVQDSFNLGAIIRSAEVLGFEGVIVGAMHQTGVNSQVVRSSAGAVNHIPILRESDLVQVVRSLREAGFQMIAASEKGTHPCHAADFHRPTVLIIGNEGSGIRRELLDACDMMVTIPQSGRMDSLNAAVSAGILCYELSRQRSVR